MDLPLPPLNPQLVPKIQPRLMKDTYKKVHIYLFDFDLLLGKGSFSKVYKGINLNTNEQVAVKVVEMNSITTPKLKQLLLQEIDILMKIKNENLIKCFEVLSSAKNTYIVMELCTYDFGTVCEFIQKQQEIEKSTLIEKQPKLINSPQFVNYCNSPKSPPFSPVSSPSNKTAQLTQTESLTKSIDSISSTKSVQIDQISEDYDGKNRFGFQLNQTLKQQKFYPFIRQIFQGLQYLQHQNIVHRDIKLSNIFLTPSKACKIGDFGFATIIPHNQVEIKDTCCIGSPLYMSPQSYIQNVYSLKSDIWSFGILIFEMIYGNPPHWNCPTHEILKIQIKKQIDLRKFQKLCKISDDLKEVLEGCLQVDIRKRFSIQQLKQTRLFKRLFYQPLESKVIFSSRQKENIEESSVEVLGRPMLRNDSIKPEYKNLEYSNSSKIQKVRQGSVGLCLIDKNKFGRGEYSLPLRKAQKVQTFMPNLEEPFQTLQENNSFTDRPSENENKNSKRAFTSTKLGEHSYKESEDLKNIKTKSTDLNEKIFKEVSRLDDKKGGMCHMKSNSSQQKQQFIYKNSEEMQKFLKEMKETRKTSETKNTSNLIIKDSPITFTDLTNVFAQGKNPWQEQEEESPKFATTFSGPFFNSPKYEKKQKSGENRKSIELVTNYSMFENPTKKTPKPSTSYSPRNNLSYLEDPNNTSITKQTNKQNLKEETLVTKNQSCGNYSSSSNKHYSINKEPQKYEYKKKMLDKCISTPKFQSYQIDSIKKPQEEDKNTKYMTTSSFLTSTTQQARSPRGKNSSASNIIKELNIKQQLSSKNPTRKSDFLTTNTKSFQGTNNLLYQFSSKAKQPTHIQKKTYWKGFNSKNFMGNGGDKSIDLAKNQISAQSSSQNQSTLRNHSTLFTQMSPTHEQQQWPSYLSGPSFKLLNGELIIQDACQLIHFSRLLHKISFTTENNGNSILLLQYAIQILRNLLEKCENFEIKYHYDSSTSNHAQIREAFKSNDLYLNNLLVVNEKECYAIKRDALSNNSKDTSSNVCNKTLQLKTIIESYIKKYLQRKQALIKLFECNILFQNLTNKVKQAKFSSHQNSPADKLNIKKRSSMNCERGFLNFSRLEKVIEEIEIQLSNKKQTPSNNNKNIVSSSTKPLSQSFSNKLLLKTAGFYIQAIQRCVSDHSFMRLMEFVISIMTLSNQRIEWDFLKENRTNEMTKIKSVIERLLQGCSNEQKNNARSPSHYDSNSDTFDRNYSMLVGNSNK